MTNLNLLAVDDEHDAVDAVKDLSDQELLRQVPLVLQSDRDILMCEVLDEVGARGLHEAAPHVSSVIEGHSGSDMARAYAIHAAHDLSMSGEVLRYAKSRICCEQSDEASLTACAYGLGYDATEEDKMAMQKHIFAMCRAGISEGRHYPIYATINAFRNFDFGADPLIVEVVVGLWRECPSDWGAKEDLRELVDELGAGNG